MDVLGSKRHWTGTVGQPEVRFSRPSNDLGTEPLAQPPKIRRRVAALCKAGTELGHRKSKDLSHGFGLRTYACSVTTTRR
jgi:hypothetical protein